MPPARTPPARRSPTASTVSAQAPSSRSSSRDTRRWSPRRPRGSRRRPTRGRARDAWRAATTCVRSARCSLTLPCCAPCHALVVEAPRRRNGSECSRVSRALRGWLTAGSAAAHAPGGSRAAPLSSFSPPPSVRTADSVWFCVARGWVHGHDACVSGPWGRAVAARFSIGALSRRVAVGAR